ncbi:uncharacterized protein G2W53_041905 [Senna tora]|uniref:Uncharacterized protein n=1 Tax=Senna tora TaxID=362788 RepID=A0A834SFY3_9FABA|nr:uncharacterized protein G2W53_041905 [Senna tora]
MARSALFGLTYVIRSRYHTENRLLALDLG